MGTSGWHYNHWKGRFYPEGMPNEEMLDHYVKYFKSVEINQTFYGLPRKDTLRRWREKTPKDFTFAVKGSRYLTHMKKLKDPKPALFRFFDVVGVLQEKLGPILFQLPPHWKFNRQRLRDFLRLLPRDYVYAFEFRNATWFCEEAYELLSEAGASFCIYELAGTLSPEKLTSDLVYIRLHGPKGPYQGNYSEAALAGWAGRIQSWSLEGKEVRCYFDNDDSGYAPQNALRLSEILRMEV